MAAQVPYMSRQCPHRVDLILSEAQSLEALAFARSPTTPGFFGFWRRVHSTEYTIVQFNGARKIRSNQMMIYEFRFSDPNVALEAKFKFG